MKVILLLFCFTAGIANISQANPRLKIPEPQTVSRSRRDSFFGDIEDPFRTMRRSFQGLTTNVGRSMQNFMSVISSSMKSMQAGLFNRSPKHISFLPPSNSYQDPSNSYQDPSNSYQDPSNVYQDPSNVYQDPSNVYQEPSNSYTIPSFSHPDSFPVQYVKDPVQHVHQGVYNPDCDCNDESPFIPVGDNTLDGYKEDDISALEEYGSPQSSVIAEEYGSPQSSVISEEYGSPLTPVVAEYNPEPVYQPISTGNSGQYNPVQQTVQIVPVEQYTPAQPEYTIVQPVVTVQNTPVQTVHVVQPVQPTVQYTPVQPSSAEYTEVQQVDTVQYSTAQPTTAPIQYTTTTLYDIPVHLTDEEICAHIKQHKEDIHRSPVNHAGGSNDVDIHKLETVGVHSEHKQSSAVVPDQIHPEKYISIDCENVKKVVGQRLYYKDTKPLKDHLHGQNKVRETLVI